MKKVILGFLFIISLSILLLILFMPFGGGLQTIDQMVTKGVFGMINYPDLSNVKETYLNIVDPLLSTISLLSLIGGIIVPLRFKSTINSRLKWSSILTGIPIALLLGWNLFFPQEDNSAGGVKDGFATLTYIWHEGNYDRIKEWRSEKCNTCYAPGERIKWIFIREYKEKRN